ncbi:unnamed protein product [Fusarium graminearum]|uniref:Chromosome 3, complete genome n=2 Tax=Gibberella zeae TaxID=5518 RepID=A0A098DYM9_GIBZE|nr:unnamed protein product [Fusarium graminearum]CAF3553369.1 unnamed protein product [Fusarium graminearum]CAG1971498.1 unnamed protein product [Fusarium graminearum]CAG2007958.1 unnamed protein product [Fusarium graminearum]CEF86976.1 unnamed protein product [Fusarium graminearum]
MYGIRGIRSQTLSAGRQHGVCGESSHLVKHSLQKVSTGCHLDDVTDKLSRGGLAEKRDKDSQARTETPRNHFSLLTNKERPTRYARTAYHKDRGAMFEP